MPNPVNHRRGEQWETCTVCGSIFPVSHLTTQKGRVVCTRDLDNLVPERREAEIQRVLGTGRAEGADLRGVDLAFFVGQVDEIVR